MDKTFAEDPIYCYFLADSRSKGTVEGSFGHIICIDMAEKTHICFEARPLGVV